MTVISGKLAVTSAGVATTPGVVAEAPVAVSVPAADALTASVVSTRSGANAGLSLAPPRLGAMAFRGSRDLVRELTQRKLLDLKAADADHDNVVTETELWDDYTTRVQQRDLAAYRAIGAAVEAANPDYKHQMGDADLQPGGRSERCTTGEFKAGAPDISEYMTQSLARYAAAMKRDVNALTDTERFNATVLAYGQLGIHYDAKSDPLEGIDGSVRQPAHAAMEIFAKRGTGGVCIDQANLFARMARYAGLPAQVMFVRNIDAQHQNSGAHAIARVRIDGRDHDIEEQTVLTPARASAFADAQRSPQGTAALQRMKAATVNMRGLTPLSDLGAYACELGNSAWTRIRASLDPTQSVSERQRFLAHGYEDALRASLYDPRATLLSDNVMAAKLSAFQLYGDRTTLNECVARADAVLARSDLTTSDRLNALCRKLEAELALGASTEATLQQLTAVGAKQGEGSFTYGPIISRSRALKAALGTRPAKVQIALDQRSLANLRQLMRARGAPEALTPAIIRRAEEMP